MTLRNKIYKIISNMLNKPDANGIYPTTKCFDELETLIFQEKVTFATEIKNHLCFHRMNTESDMKGITGNNEEIWMFKKKDILELKKLDN